jgi:fatty acid desaturase
MNVLDQDAYAARSKALDLDGIAWDDVARHPLSPAAVRTLRYMQDVETHTIVYERELAQTRVLDDPEIVTFLACWLYEETFHGRALRRFLAAAGHPTPERGRGGRSLAARLESAGIALVARAWPDFVAVHMTWGAINEYATLVGYQRLAALERHPVLSALVARIVRDEARHFAFYFKQAAKRLARPGASRVARFLVDRFWDPVGTGVQPASETRFVARHLFGGASGRDAARDIDGTIRRLPGFGDVALVEAWIDRHAA